MAKPIHTNRQGTVTNSKEDATSKTPAIPTLHNPLRHNKPMEGDSNKGAPKVDMVRLRRRIQVVQVRPTVVTVRQISRTSRG